LRAAHERLEARRALKLLELVHTTNPTAMHQKILREIDPPTGPIETPFSRMLARARADAAAR
jgi:hypothetical protein